MSDHFVTFEVTIEAHFTSKRETVHANAAAREFLAKLTSVAQPLVITLGGAKLQRYSLPQDTADMPPQLQAGAILEYTCESFDSRDGKVEDNRAAEHAADLAGALAPLVDIADAYDANELDDSARKTWGPNDEHENTQAPTDIELYSGRGGRQLLTLEHCMAARRAVKGG